LTCGYPKLSFTSHKFGKISFETIAAASLIQRDVSGYSRTVVLEFFSPGGLEASQDTDAMPGWVVGGRVRDDQYRMLSNESRTSFDVTAAAKAWS
jgi:hypothetical protein